MANPSEVGAYIRFALSQLSARNGHHEFEHICRYLTQQFICSNVLPATGPVSAGGDQGRDFETFRTYLRGELGPHGGFLGLVSEGTIAFVCTIQADNLLAKLRQDIKKVCTSGHPVHEIYAFTLQSVPKGSRSKLQTETQESYDVHLEFHDAESISNLLARPEGFWIAEQFLSLPADLRPDVSEIEDELAAEYVEQRCRWRAKGSPNPTFGDFIDLKTGLRNAVFSPKARSDLPFWLGILRDLLANPELPPHVQQRARYELVVATLRGTGYFHAVDDVARAYLEESLNETESARLQDASVLLLYANTAVRKGLSSLTSVEIQTWNGGLANRIEDLVTHATPDQRAILLFTLGQLGLHPTLTEADIQGSGGEPYLPEDLYQDGKPPSLSDHLVLTDSSRTLSAWTELMANLKNTPLFPIQSMADFLQLLVPLWSRQDEWRALLDIVDEAVGKRSGKHIIAARARDRAMMLLRDGRRLDALEELHLAKIDWWSGETIRGSLLAMFFIADLYFRLHLPQAAKSYALAVAYIAGSKGDEELADLIPAGLLMAARADFVAGAWCSAMELYEFGLAAQREFVEDGTDSDKHPEVQNAILHLALINSCARCVDADLTASIGDSLDRIGARTIVEELIDDLGTADKDFWKSFGGKEHTARPFVDLGDARCIRFAALGTAWTVTADNDTDSVREAERFAAAAQVLLAALARDDLCLVPTQINVRIDNTRPTSTSVVERIKALPSNDGQEWLVRLTPVKTSGVVSPDRITTELLTMLTIILREASLLPESDFLASIERAFERGLGHKLSAGRPYDELAASFAADKEHEFQRTQYNTPWDCRGGSFVSHDELCWQDGPGPTYSLDTANELLENRYRTLAKGIRITVEMLKSSKDFRPTVMALRAYGWLDWHVLAAIANIVINYRVQSAGLDWLSDATQKQMTQAISNPESATAAPVPITSFTAETLDIHRRFSMMSLLKIWGLECHQETPDMPAIERLLAARYAYWDDDVPHDDPFPDFEKRANSDGLIVITDVPPTESL